MKPVDQVVACVLDYGTFISLAEKLGETLRKVYYHSPCDGEFRLLQDCIKGDGLANVERIDEFTTPEIIDEVDLWVVPDIGYGGFQKDMRRQGKAVWGSAGADELELYRTKFIAMLKEVGLPVPQYERIVGLPALAEHLKTVEDKWIKVNRYRGNMETWHHDTYLKSQGELNRLAMEFGGLSDKVVFVVQDAIDATAEIGYDGFSVDGQFPDSSFQGYEKKNELYLGSLLNKGELPDEVQAVNEAMAPVLARYEYRNFIATEIRKTKDSFYFIDPTMRMPGQTGEQLLESCTNLPNVMWHGANGMLLQPEFCAKFAAEATLHYTGTAPEGWMRFGVPEKSRRWFKLYHFCEDNGEFIYPPKDDGELGVVLGLGDTIEEAIDHLKENLEAVKGEPVKAKIEGFVDLIKQIEDAEAEGMKFTDQEIPEPVSVLE